MWTCVTLLLSYLLLVFKAFVEAGEELEAEEYEDLDHEYGVYAHQLLSDGTNRHIYGSPVSTPSPPP